MGLGREGVPLRDTLSYAPLITLTFTITNKVKAL